MEQEEERDLEQAQKRELEQAEQNMERCMEQAEQIDELTAEEEKIKQLSDLLKEMSADKSILSQFF